MAGVRNVFPRRAVYIGKHMTAHPRNRRGEKWRKRRKDMKKAAFLLALVMLLGLLPGCSQAEGEASVQSVSMICGLGSVGLADRFAASSAPWARRRSRRTTP